MARDILQPVRGTAAQVSAYTGPVAELVWNVETKTFHGQDGATPGGIPLLNEKALGKDIGISFRPFQERLLVDRTHGPSAQAVMEMQIRTRPGNLGPTTGVNDGIGAGFVVVSDAKPDTKYGHFNFISKIENNSFYVSGQEAQFGHVSAALYANQNRIDATPAWACAMETKETHNLPNPVNPSLCFEATVIARGTDNFNNRCIGYMPFNVHRENAQATFVYTEFAQGFYFKNDPAYVFVKDCILYEGKYGTIMNAREVIANNLIKATGIYNEGVIDLHAVSQAGPNSTAIALNGAHNIQWRTANNDVVGAFGFDSVTNGGRTPIITGVRTQSNVGGAAGYAVININGTRMGIPLFNLA